MPLAFIVVLALNLFAIYTFVFSFRELLNVEDTNKFVLISVATLVVSLIIICLILSEIYNIKLTELTESLNGLNTLTKLF